MVASLPDSDQEGRGSLSPPDVFEPGFVLQAVQFAQQFGLSLTPLATGGQVPQPIVASTMHCSGVPPTVPASFRSSQHSSDHL